MPPTPTSPPGLRADYESSPLTIKALAAKYDVSKHDITRYRLAERWTARPNDITSVKAFRLASQIQGLALATLLPPALSPDGKPEDPSSTDGSLRDPSSSAAAARKKFRGSPAHRKDLIARLHSLIEAKIAEIESRLAARVKVSAADSERESKAIGFFIKQLEQLKDVADAEARSRRAADSPAAATDPTAALEAERLRNDLVERLDRIRRARPDTSAAERPDDIGA
jgi:hypothetical protein